MANLRVCDECQRHIREDESDCPFCTEVKGQSAAPGPLRTAVIAGAIAGASALGCGDAKPAVEDPSHKADPVEVGQSDAMPANPDDGELREEEMRRRQVDPDMPPMPYGAPPLRRRLV